MPSKQNERTYRTNKGPGCSSVLAYLAWSLWIIILSAVDLYTNWQVEQALVEDSYNITDFRWLTHLILIFILFISLLIGRAVTKNVRLKSALTIWTLAAGLSMATAPVKMLWITFQQETAVMDICLLMLFLFGLNLYHRRHPEEQSDGKSKTSYFGLAVLVAVGMTIPFALWGALGSVYDTLVYVTLGAFFAYFTVDVLYTFFFSRLQVNGEEPKVRGFLLEGFIIALFFLLVITGFGQNGSQPLLLIALPVSGWVIAIFEILSRNTRGWGRFPAGLISGVALAVPLIFFDADELSQIISGGSGETLEWALKAAWAAFSVCSMVIIINLINLKNMTRFRITQKFNWIISAIMVGSLALVYFIFGHPGFYGDKLFIVMKTQADLGQAEKITNVAERRAAVYQELVSTADVTQKDIRGQLDSWHVKYTPYYLVNGLEIDVNPYLQMVIAKRSDVERVLESPHLRPLPSVPVLTNSSKVDKPEEPTWNLTLIGADKVHSELKITGEGIVVGQTDSGADGRDLQLAGSYRGQSGSDDYNWLDPWNGSAFPTDTMGHGTETLGIITGKDIGVAPGAKWIGCVNLGRNLGNTAYYLNCMQFMLAPYPQGGSSFYGGDPAKGAMIVNNSWGCPQVEGCDSKTFEQAVKAMETAGIFMSVAAGNTGYYGCSTVTDPLAIYPEVFTVGSINRNGNISEFSSLGPVAIDGSNRVKPNIMAPGEDIILAFPGNEFTQASGTSFAAPHVTGVVALMWSANHNLIGNIALTEKILEDTATPYTGTIPACVTDSSIPNDASGYGVVNAYAAVQKAISLK